MSLEKLTALKAEHDANEAAFKEVQAQVDILTKRRSEIQQNARDLRKFAPKAVYEYTAQVKIQESQRWHCAIPEGVEVISLHGRCVNKDELAAWKFADGGFSRDTDDTHSLRYWRYNGKIIAEGGGHCILEPGAPCSDEQWEQLKLGKIDPSIKHKSTSW